MVLSVINTWKVGIWFQLFENYKFSHQLFIFIAMSVISMNRLKSRLCVSRVVFLLHHVSLRVPKTSSLGNKTDYKGKEILSNLKNQLAIRCAKMLFSLQTWRKDKPQDDELNEAMFEIRCAISQLEIS